MRPDPPAFRLRVPAGSLQVPGFASNVPVGTGLEIDTAGDFNVKVPPPTLDFDGIDIQDGGPVEISLAYDGGQPDFQFQGRAVGALCSAARADFRVQFGSAGGRVCHRICTDGCAESVCLTFP